MALTKTTAGAEVLSALQGIKARDNEALEKMVDDAYSALLDRISKLNKLRDMVVLLERSESSPTSTEEEVLRRLLKRLGLENLKPLSFGDDDTDDIRGETGGWYISAVMLIDLLEESSFEASS